MSSITYIKIIFRGLTNYQFVEIFAHAAFVYIYPFAFAAFGFPKVCLCESFTLPATLSLKKQKG